MRERELRETEKRETIGGRVGRVWVLVVWAWAGTLGWSWEWAERDWLGN